MSKIAIAKMSKKYLSYNLGMEFPDWATKVTPFSKAVALAMLGGLPFLGFMLGVKYQKKVTMCPVRGSDIKIVKIQKADTQEDLIQRCGDFPENIFDNDLFSVQDVIWAPDCRNIAWYQRRSPFNMIGQNKEGVWVYDDIMKKSRLIFLEKNASEYIHNLMWINEDQIQFNTGERMVIYSLSLEGVLPYGE